MQSRADALFMLQDIIQPLDQVRSNCWAMLLMLSLLLLLANEYALYTMTASWPNGIALGAQSLAH